MSNKSKAIVAVIGIIVGIAIIVVGFNVKDARYTYTDTDTIGRYISFGADFYTEMYSVTKDVGMAVNNNTMALRNVTDVLSDICNAIGWLIISIGAIDICFFGYILIKPSSVSVNGTDVDNTTKATKHKKTDSVKNKTPHSNNKPSINTSSQKNSTEMKNKQTENVDSDESFVDVDCPECGETISVLPNQTAMVCPWCNTKIDIKL